MQLALHYVYVMLCVGTSCNNSLPSSGDFNSGHITYNYLKLTRRCCHVFDNWAYILLTLRKKETFAHAAVNSCPPPSLVCLRWRVDPDDGRPGVHWQGYLVLCDEIQCEGLNGKMHVSAAPSTNRIRPATTESAATVRGCAADNTNFFVITLKKKRKEK